MSDSGQWIVRVPNLTQEIAFEISEDLERQQEQGGAAHHAVASFCAGMDDDWAVEISYQVRPEQTLITEILSPYRDRDGGTPTGQFLPLETRDWVRESLKNLTPVRAGRFFVHGRHDQGARPAGAISIEIEANQAFGSGHHETTAGCLEALDRELRHTRYRNSLDLGCGSAVLAIAIAKSGLGHVLATDIDPVALEIGKGNTRLNNVASRVTCIVADGLNHPNIRKRQPFDLVMANILSGPLIALANPIRNIVAPGGTIILSGILTRQAPGVEAAYRAAGFMFRHRLIKREWATLVFENRGRPRYV
jgi:ribosomal protein L11 methyltransferase